MSYKQECVWGIHFRNRFSTSEKIRLEVWRKQKWHRVFQSFKITCNFYLEKNANYLVFLNRNMKLNVWLFLSEWSDIWKWHFSSIKCLKYMLKSYQSRKYYFLFKILLLNDIKICFSWLETKVNWSQQEKILISVKQPDKELWDLKFLLDWLICKGSINFRSPEDNMYCFILQIQQREKAKKATQFANV